MMSLLFLFEHVSLFFSFSFAQVRMKVCMNYFALEYLMICIMQVYVCVCTYVCLYVCVRVMCITSIMFV